MGHSCCCWASSRDAPKSIAQDASGRLFVLLLSSVVVFSANGTQLTEITPVDPSIAFAGGLVVDSAGELIVSIPSYNRVVRYSATGSSIQQSDSFLPPNNPHALALDASENIYYTATYSTEVVQLSPNLSVVAKYSASSPPLYYPADLFVTPDGSIFIADCGNDCVVQLAANGSQVAVLVADDPPLHCPTGVVVDANGDVIVSDYYNDLLVVFSNSPSVCQAAQSPSSSSASSSSFTPSTAPPSSAPHSSSSAWSSSSSSPSSFPMLSSTLSTSNAIPTSHYTGGQEESSSSSSRRMA